MASVQGVESEWQGVGREWAGSEERVAGSECGGRRFSGKTGAPNPLGVHSGQCCTMSHGPGPFVPIRHDSWPRSGQAVARNAIDSAFRTSLGTGFPEIPEVPV